MNLWVVVWIWVALWTGVRGAVKGLSQNCLCDVTSGCDEQCCCDGECGSGLVTYWNEYSLCANDGFAIPFCSSFYNQPMHVHDLYQGLRLIYTVIKRLFCISKVNFIDPTAQYVTTTTDAQIPTLVNSVSAVNSNVLSLSTLGSYGSLPLRNGMGICVATKAVRSMNNIFNERCRVATSGTTDTTTNPLLSASTFITSNALDSTKLKIYLMETSSIPPSTATTAASIPVCSVNVCYVIKQIKLFFISSTSAVDYNSSYLVVGPTTVGSPSYLYLRYSYQFIQDVNLYPHSSTLAYTFGSELVLLGSDGTKSYRVFNPVNIGLRKLDGSCRTVSTDESDQTNLIHLMFGVNSIYTCIGSASFTEVYNNIKGSINMVGSFGSTSTNLNDFIKVIYPATPSANDNLQLIFHYISLGTQASPQYQILKAELKTYTSTVAGQKAFYVEYQPISNLVTLNVPNPPTIDAYLPDDFLYPFYVA